MTSLNADGLMQDVVAGNFADETDGLEWKIGVDLTDRRWQARVAKFILGAANSIKEVADLGSGIAGVMVLGAEPGRIDARPVIDRAVLDNGLQRFLGRSSPDYALHYVPAGDGNYVTVVVVPMSPASMRPWTAHQSYSDPKGEIISDGGIYVRRGSRTEKAKAADIVELLRQRDFAVSMGPRPHELAWLDGDTLHLRHIKGSGGLHTKLVIQGPSDVERLLELAKVPLPLPDPLPTPILDQLGVFDRLDENAIANPELAIEECWAPMRKRVVDAHRRVFGQDNPVDGVKVEYLVADMAEANRLDPIWARISTVLYWLGPCDDETPRAARGHARTYIRLARALVAAVLIAAPERISDGSP